MSFSFLFWWWWNHSAIRGCLEYADLLKTVLTLQIMKGDKWMHVLLRLVAFHSAIPWTADCQAPLSMGLPGQECWSGLRFPTPADLPKPGIESTSLVSCVSFTGRWILYHWVTLEAQSESSTGEKKSNKWDYRIVGPAPTLSKDSKPDVLMWNYTLYPMLSVGIKHFSIFESIERRFKERLSQKRLTC